MAGAPAAGFSSHLGTAASAASRVARRTRSARAASAWVRRPAVTAAWTVGHSRCAVTGAVRAGRPLDAPAAFTRSIPAVPRFLLRRSVSCAHTTEHHAVSPDSRPRVRSRLPLAVERQGRPSLGFRTCRIRSTSEPSKPIHGDIRAPRTARGGSKTTALTAVTLYKGPHRKQEVSFSLLLHCDFRSAESKPSRPALADGRPRRAWPPPPPGRPPPPWPAGSARRRRHLAAGWGVAAPPG
jgi:hypothetical protein